MNRLYAAAAFVLLLAAPAWAQQSGPRVQARLIAEQSSARPGGTLTLALEQVIRPGWHTYWVNPGDVGQPTSIDWALPSGWTAGAIQWPAPRQLPVGPFMDYGYEGKVWLLTDVAVPADARPGDTLTLKAIAHFLVCQQICVPEDATLSLPVTIGDGAAVAALAPQFAAARAALPVASPWKLDYALGSDLDLYVAAPALAAAHPASARFFALTPGTIKGPAPQQMGFTKDGLVLRLTPGDKIAARGGILSGVLVLKSSDGSVQALSVAAPPGPVPPASFAAAPGQVTLLLAIAFAFLGGLILNVMPCVLPILAMKALALANSGGAPGQARKDGLAYGAGAVLSFLVFGLVIVALRAGGAAVGWGFQLQQPAAVAAFALLIFAVGLNLSGVFAFGTITLGDNLAARGGVAGAFFTGVLAVAVAAPCTAPFMAAALGFALTQSVIPALLVFLGLGIGFALPFVLLGLWPRALAFLPRPGPWMVRLKQFLAFPMYGAAVWLAWVVAQQAGANGALILLAGAVAVALALWLWNATRGLGTRGRGVGALAGLAILIAVFYGLTLLSGAAAPPVAATAGASGFSDARLASLRAAGRPVFVDATAAWCITCLVNEQAVLSRAPVRQAFADKNVAYLVADWTNRNAAITRLLEANGRSGVPLYLYYAPGAGAPVILPQILTQASVLAAIGS